MYWIHLEQDRVQWQALVNRVMNFGFHRKCRISWLAKWLSFWRRTLIHGVCLHLMPQGWSVLTFLAFFPLGKVIECISEVWAPTEGISLLPIIGWSWKLSWQRQTCNLMWTEPLWGALCSLHSQSFILGRGEGFNMWTENLHTDMTRYWTHDSLNESTVLPQDHLDHLYH